MNKLGVFLMVMMLMTVGSVMAIPTGFHLDNSIAVTGDWVYDNGWTLPTEAPVTASYDMAIDSALATSATFSEEGVFGSPWYLSYKSFATANAPVKFENTLAAITVNPPDTTPATAWTKIKYAQTSVAGFSGAALTINGYGNIAVNSKIVMSSAGAQETHLNIN